ncbi:phage tail protein I [Pseudomonas abyssi]|uniref:Phage tail protein I n=1 Tax=Pseudomonas abyssi TaxID=170540 RepID=A0A395R2T8_9PSED|nr:phage tail protein I [Halopseudomonas gallaeciensis]RGP54413.1 hypothetical protein ASB58_11065 [Halopseudomonas gallaeciensis]
MSDASLLPPNATAAERALASAGVRLNELPLPHRTLHSAQESPPQLLPWLAWEFSVDEWDPNWAEDQKRGAIAASISIHRHKGTIGAVRAGLAGIGINVRVQEWFAQIPQGEPGTFHLLINASQYPVTLENLHRVIAVLEQSKNLRSHMTLAQLSATTVATLRSAAVSVSGHDIGVTYAVSSLALIMEGLANGEQPTQLAASNLHTLINETMPAAGYW